MAVSAATVAYIAAAASAASAAISIAMMVQQKGRNNGDITDSGVSISRKGKDDPKIVPFGKSIIPATKVFVNVADNNRKWLTEVFSLGHGPLKSINQIYIDEQPLFAFSEKDLSEQWWNSASFKDGFWNLQVGVRRGLKTNATWDPIVTHSDGLWSNNHRGDATGTISMLIERPDPKDSGSDKHRILSDKFQVEALVEGIKVIDPRVDPTLKGWNDSDYRVWIGNGKESYRNPALCLLTYLADQEFGFGIDPKFIDLNSFINTANWCEANKITLDGFIDQGNTFGNIVKQFVNSFNGFCFLENGKIKVMPDTISPVMFNITEDDIHNDISVSNNSGDYINTCKVEFQNRDTEYNKDMFVLPKDANDDPTIREDGRIFEKTVDCTLSTDPAYAKLVANMELKRAKLCRRGVTMSLSNLDLPIRVGYVFTIEHALYELDKNIKWRITSVENSLDKDTLISKITAEQYDERVYDTTSYDDGNLSSSLPRPDFTILPVTNLKFTQNASNTVGSGMLSFDPQYMGDARFVVQYKLSSSSVWVQYGEFPFSNISMVSLQTGVNYDFRVQTRAPIGASAWTTITNQKVNRVINLPAVQNLKADFTSADCVITFDPITGAIPNTTVVGDGITNMSQLVKHYKVDVQHNTGTSYSYYTNNGRFVYTYDTNAKNGLERRLNITVTPVSLYGDIGDKAVVSAYNEPMGQPASVLVESELVNLTVSWLNPSDLAADYDSTDIWITDTKVAPSLADLVANSNVGFWTAVRQSGKKKGWVYIAHRDVFGHPAIPVYSVPIYFEETTIDDLITDSAFEGNFKELQDNVNKIDGDLAELGKEVDANKVEVDNALTNQQNQINTEKDRLNGTISDLAETEADLNQAKLDILKNATDIKTNKTELTSQGARLTTVEQVASDITGSIATVSQRVEVVNKDLSAKIETNRQSIVTTNAAMASMETRLKADIGKNTAAITQTNKTVADLDSTVASMDTRLTSSINKNTADIKTTQQSVADLNGSMSTIRTELSAKIDTNTSNITVNKTAIAATDKNLADYKLTVSTEFGKTNGRIDTVQSSVSTLEKTVATQGTTIQANYNDLSGKIQVNQTAITDANKAITSLDTKLSAQIKGVDDKANAIKATVDQQAITIAATDKALTELRTSTTAQFGTVNSRIDTVQTNLATTDKALADYKIEANAKIGKNSADIKINATAITTTNTALSTYQTKNDAEVNGLKASVQTISQAQVGTDGKVSAIYGLRVDAGGKVAGMTLGATDQGSTIDFLAGSLRIANASNDGTPVTAFEVRGGKVMMRNALIGDLTATNIRVGSLNGQEIAANGVIRAGTGAQSATLDGASPDWRLYIGNAANPYAAPFRVDKYGNAWMDNAFIRGTVNATAGSFTGEIYCKTGRFDGPVYMANNAYISGDVNHNFIVGANGRFVVDQSGNVTCQYGVFEGGYFRGTVFVQSLQGDVYRKSFYSQAVIAGRFLQGGSGEKEFLRVNIGSQQFSQRLVLSNVNAPIRQDETGGSATLYYQIEGQAAVEYQRTGGIPWDLAPFTAEIPAGATWVRFFVIPHNRTYFGRQTAIPGIMETMKFETVGMSVATVG
ncbi:phage tail protein [Aeromonas hydrophila]|uniref:phage tail protein n=1 Tax=Aeromonas hydrophila TaxID=644 RepID=UPI001F606EFB|nr:phage tail protein [Aeromonas hydrophila]UNU29649.1 DUF1983 domain-containing protein [Aeromonas hydrophila]